MFFDDHKKRALVEIKVSLFKVVHTNTTERAEHTFLTSEEARTFYFKTMERHEEEGTYFDLTFYEKDVNLRDQFIFGHSSDRVRVAHPDHCIFIRAYATDCDGISGVDFVSFQSIEEAHEWFDEVWYPSLEGSSGYSSLSREEWENEPYPGFRDPYAESMGY